MWCSLFTPFFFKKKDKNRLFIFYLWVVFLSMCVISYFGTGFFAHVQPARFIVVSGILVSILVAQLLFKTFALHKRIVVLFFCLILFAQACLCSGFLSKIIGENKDNSIKDIFRCCATIMDGSDISKDIMADGGGGLVNRIMELTDASGRILIEDSRHVEVYWGSNFLAVLPSSREFIGGPHNCMQVIHRFASFSDGEIFFKRIERIGIEKFMEYMDLYNIKWAFVHSKDSKEYFESYSQYFKKISSYEHIDVYQINRQTSYFVEGGGNIKSSLDKIKITNASKGNIIIKYHYLETLKSCPEVDIEKFYMLDDPVGFIKINNEKGYDMIKIYND